MFPWAHVHTHTHTVHKDAYTQHKENKKTQNKIVPIQPQYVATVLKAPKGWFSDIEECQRNLHHEGLQPPVATKKGNHTHGSLYSLYSVPLQLSSGDLPKILQEYGSEEGVNKTASSLFFFFF